MRIYLDEWLDNDTQYGNHSEEIRELIINKHNHGENVEDIVKFLQDKYYLLDETEYITWFVKNIIDVYYGK